MNPSASAHGSPGGAEGWPTVGRIWICWQRAGDSLPGLPDFDSADVCCPAIRDPAGLPNDEAQLAPKVAGKRREFGSLASYITDIPQIAKVLASLFVKEAAEQTGTLRTLRVHKAMAEAARHTCASAPLRNLYAHRRRPSWPVAYPQPTPPVGPDFHRS